MKITKVREVKTPVRGTPGSAGIDFFVPDDFPGTHFLIPGQAVNIPSGIHVRLPLGTALIAMNKSGMAVKKDLQVGASVIDEDYQGEVHLHVRNIGTDMQEINPGDKLVQMLLVPILYNDVQIVDSLEDLYKGETTERGTGGFGSTGTK